MAFSPKYTVTAQMLANLAKIEVIKQQFENQPISPQLLFLYRADDDAGYKVFLQEGIDHQQRDGGYHDLGRVEGPVVHGGQLLELVGVRNLGQVHGKLLDVGLQGIHLRLGHIDQAAEEIVPAPHDAEQGDGCYGRLGAGHHDSQKNLKLVGAVNDRRFLQGLGNAPEEVHQQDDAEDGDRARKDQGPDGVEKMKIFYKTE